MQRPNVTDRITALICRSQIGIFWSWSSFIVRNCCVRFQSMARGKLVKYSHMTPSFSQLVIISPSSSLLAHPLSSVIGQRQGVKDSAYHKTSKPLFAATLSGMKRVCSGSTMPIVGRIARLAIPEDQNTKLIQQVVKSHKIII